MLGESNIYTLRWEYFLYCDKLAAVTGTRPRPEARRGWGVLHKNRVEVNLPEGMLDGST